MNDHVLRRERPAARNPNGERERMVRRKIEIKSIEDKSKRHTTFTKRRKGLMEENLGDLHQIRLISGGHHLLWYDCQKIGPHLVR